MARDRGPADPLFWSELDAALASLLIGQFRRFEFLRLIGKDIWNKFIWYNFLCGRYIALEDIIPVTFLHKVAFGVKHKKDVEAKAGPIIVWCDSY